VGRLCFDEIVNFIDEYEATTMESSFFDICAEEIIWEHAEAIVNSEHSVSFVRILDDNIDKIDLIKAKSLFLSTLESTNNPLLYSNICKFLIKNNESLDSAENRKIESIVKIRFQLSDQGFIKEKSLETLTLLMINHKIGKYKTLSVFEDIDENWTTHLVVKSVKMLGLVYDQFPEEDIFYMITKMLQSQDPLILSETAHQTGLIYLRNALESFEAADLVKNLKKAQECFRLSFLTIENRDDAKFYNLVIEAMLCLAGSSHIDKSIQSQLEEVINKRSYYISNDDLNIQLELSMFQLIENLKLAVTRINEIKSWLDISSEIISLAKIYCYEKQCGFRDSFYRSFDYSIKNVVFVPKVQIAISHKLQDARHKLELIKQNNSSVLEEKEVWFIDAILNYCLENSDPVKVKKKEIRDQILISLASNLDMSSEALKSFVEELDQSIENDTLEQFLIDQFNALGMIFSSQNDYSYATGSSIGDEILNSISNDIRKNLPQYPIEKLRAYQTVFTDLIRYNIYVNDVQRIDRGRIDRSFLFSKVVGGSGQDAVEEDLQNDLYNFLVSGSSIAQFIEWEEKNVASGRVDIRYNFGDLRYPVEIKKEYNNISPNYIKKMYISQAQTYTASYEQLGFFMVLDLTEKQKDEPPVNIRDHFYLTRLEPQKDLVVNYPDYVTVIIISGNRLTPTKRSTYSRK
jgi:hypothetical protein